MLTGKFATDIFITMEVLKGISASSGIAIGKSFVIDVSTERIIPKFSIQKENQECEWQRLEKAINVVHNRIEKKVELVEDQHKKILQTYLIMLEDIEFLKQVKSVFFKELLNVEYILNQNIQELVFMLSSAGDSYLAERASDISDIFGKVIDELLGIEPFDFNFVPDNVVVIAENVSPADAVILFKKKICALILTEGGSSSHLAILARTEGIPAVFGIQNAVRRITNDSTIIVNGSEGVLILEPSKEILKKYTDILLLEEKKKNDLEKFYCKKAETKDGVPISIFANIGLPEEAEKAIEVGADGIGLFRTEFLFMGAISAARQIESSGVHSITEDAQFEAYKKVLEIMKDKPVTIRTLDAGGDKLIKEAGIPIIEEQNPLLGSRAIRLTLANPDLFKRQLRALFRSSIYGNLKIMIPLVTHLSQIEETLSLINDVKQELREEEIPFRDDVPVGIMIETAAAAVAADIFSKHVDFFSIGTNDLTQYTLGIDRENASVSNLYDEKNISVLRLIQFTVEAAKKANIDVSVCGEMAGDPESALLLIAMGVRNLSMASVRIPAIKEAISRFSIKENQEKLQLFLQG